MKWRKIEIEIKLVKTPIWAKASEKNFTGKTVRVTGDAIGPLAVTPDFDGITLSDTRYRITHIQTTFKFPGCYSRRDARKIASDLHSLDWDFAKSADLPPETKKACFEYLAARDVLGGKS